MNVNYLPPTRVAFMSQDEKVKETFNALASGCDMEITAVSKSSLLSENYDVLIIDVRGNSTVSDAVLNTWEMPKIMLTDESGFSGLNYARFQATLLASEIGSGLTVALGYAQANWQKEKDSKAKVAELEFQIGCRRFLVMAELLIIKWFNCTEKDAWELIRSTAMNAQCKTDELCISILSTPEEWRTVLSARAQPGVRQTVCSRF